MSLNLPDFDLDDEPETAAEVWWDEHEDEIREDMACGVRDSRGRRLDIDNGV